MRVYLLDEQVILRAALRSFLSLRREIEVVGEGGERGAMVDVAALRPDVIVLGSERTGRAEAELVSRLRRAHAKVKVVGLTQRDDPFARETPCDVCLTKDSDPAELALAILTVQRGEPYVPLRPAQPHADGTSRGQLAELTPREHEVFQLLALGRSNKEVAAALAISLGTAKKHRENLQRKLSCGSPADIARLAIRAGLVSA